jgi:hypothetical protein
VPRGFFALTTLPVGSPCFVKILETTKRTLFEVEAERADLLSDRPWREYAHIAYFRQKANPMGMYLDSDSKSGLLSDRDNIGGGNWISKNRRPALQSIL